MKRYFLIAFALATASAFAQNAYFNGNFDANSPTWTRPTAAGVAGGRVGAVYSVQPFYVSVTGSYVFETSSFTVAPALTNLDTFEFIYQNSFDPLNPTANFVLGEDDFTGTLTVLPGPYSGVGLTTAATGSGGTQPSSRLTTNLTAGVQYYAVESSWYAANDATGRGVGPYWAGIGGGQGNVTLGAVPEPASMAILGMGALALLRRRRKA